MSAEGMTAIQPVGDENSAIRQLIQTSQRRMQLEAMEKESISSEVSSEQMRRQIDMIGFYSDRAMANEMTSRDMSSLFKSFTLINRIMQGMG